MKKVLLSLVFLAFVCVPMTAKAWNSTANFNVYLYGNNFHHVEMQSLYSNQCVIEIVVKFYSPNANYYKFQAKVTTKSGAWLRSEVFFNSAYGEREFRWTYNTADQNCWGSGFQEPSYLEVHGCEGNTCTPQPFAE